MKQNYSHHFEEVLEDIFAVFVGVNMVFFFGYTEKEFI